MAQQIETSFIDDIDGGEADGTIRFGLDGHEFEIDLNREHSDELRSTLGRYISHARKVGGTRRAGARVGRKAHSVDTVAVRTWAREHGLEIKDRGRVPAGVVEQYQTATGK